VDAVLVLAASTAVTDLDGVNDAVESVVSAEVDVPVLSVVSGDLAPPSSTSTRFRSPEAAVRSLRHAVAYGAWRRETSGSGPDRPNATASVPSGDRPGWLSAQEGAALLARAGCRTPAAATVTTVLGATAAAERLGYPVVAKACAPEIVHKSEARLVRTGLHDRRDVTSAVEDLFGALAEGAELLIQEQVAGAEIAIGVTRDDRFGPLVMLASGGVALDLWDDQVFLMPPLRRGDIRDALRSLRTWPLLEGFRGSAPVNPSALVDLVQAIGRLAEEHPDIAELDLNPVVCTTSGPVCVDVKVRLEAVATSSRPDVHRAARPGGGPFEVDLRR
jgi:acyl-CoA synthetase (NDP forming)